MRARWLVLFVLGCGAHASTPTSTPSASTTPASTPWGLPPAEADLASRRVHGSTFAHVDDTVTADKASFRKAAGAFQGQAGERDLPTPTRFSVEKGSCYRLYVDADSSIQSLAVVVEDSAGGTVLDESTSVVDARPRRALDVPARGAFCADQSAELSLKVVSGLGQGRYSVELWAKK